MRIKCNDKRLKTGTIFKIHNSKIEVTTTTTTTTATTTTTTEITTSTPTGINSCALLVCRDGIYILIFLNREERMFLYFAINKQRAITSFQHAVFRKFLV